jgi:hypothetical protein
MIDIARLPAEERERLIRSAWYSHDARWFNAVAAEFGIEAANRLNRRAVRELGKVEARRLAAALGIERANDLGEFLPFLETARALLVPGEMIELEVGEAGANGYAVEVRRCFVAENVARAGIAEVYECAVFDRLWAWHEGAGLPLAAEPAPGKCAFAEGRPCRRTFELARR